MLLLPALPVPDFWITQSIYIGLYCAGGARPGAAHRRGRAHLVRPGGLRRHRRLHRRLPGHHHAASRPGSRCCVGVALAVAGALVLGAITLRMSGHYLPLATIAWGLALNYTDGQHGWLGKYDGILGIPSMTLFGIDLGTGRGLHPLIWAIALLAALAALHLLDSRPGRAIRCAEERLDDGRGDGHLDLPLQAHGLRASRRCWPPSRAGCSRISSAASARRRSASTRASNTCSWRCWAASAMSGAPSSARPWCGWSRTSCRCCCRS